jgi:hypothetical protein
MTRRTALALLATTLTRAATRLPANKNVRWALGANLWNSFPRVPFTDILDVMKDTGFIGIRMTQFPQILKTYNITAPDLRKEATKRGCHIITISYNGPAHDPARREEVISGAKTAMNFLKEFGANHLVCSRQSHEAVRPTEACASANRDEVANEMGFRAGLHNHMGQIVQTSESGPLHGDDRSQAIFNFPQYRAPLSADHDRNPSAYEPPDAARLRRLQNRTSFQHISIWAMARRIPGLSRVLKSINFRDGFASISTSHAKDRASYERCGQYIVDGLINLCLKSRRTLLAGAPGTPRRRYPILDPHAHDGARPRIPFAEGARARRDAAPRRLDLMKASTAFRAP